MSNECGIEYEQGCRVSHRPTPLQRSRKFGKSATNLVNYFQNYLQKREFIPMKIKTPYLSAMSFASENDTYKRVIAEYNR